MPHNPIELAQISNRLRLQVIEMVARGKSCHIGSCLSVMDLLVCCYATAPGLAAQRLAEPDRDHFILSKGHAAAALYTVLAEFGYYPAERLQEYLRDGSPFIGHTNVHGIPGVEFSTGSLGHGLPVANGLALAAKRVGGSSRSFVVLSEGDCEEGSTWEAALFAAHHGLDNLVAIVDHNKIQNYGNVADVLRLEPLADKWRAFGWSVRELNGHDHAALTSALLSVAFEPNKPSAIIAHTVKGKGVSFMENTLKWHYQTPTEEEVELARRELTGV